MEYRKTFYQKNATKKRSRNFLNFSTKNPKKKNKNEENFSNSKRAK